jgi:Type I phosphodiesterase / nucleotide pyrophosphatase
VRRVRRKLALIVSPCALALVLAQDAPKPRSAIIFVADGLRQGSVNPTDTPALYRIRTEGVYFANSHSVFPTLTMPNAAALATGHLSGDTGQFANNLFISYPVFDTGNLGRDRGTMVPHVEEDAVLADINDHYGGNYLREASLLAYARSYGYNTATVGKTGPTALQDLADVSVVRRSIRPPVTIIIESATGTPSGIPLSASTLALLESAGLKPMPPARNQPEGTNTEPGTRSANVEHQQWFADVVTRAILPAFGRSSDPFVLVFWSGDPDQTQHAQGDSLNRLKPGINGPTSVAAVRNADRNLKQILDYLDTHPDMWINTNVFVTADHGFSTASRREIDAAGRTTSSYSATLHYKDADGRQEVNDRSLPPGFLAIDLARALDLPLFDPQVQTTDQRGVRRYARVDPTVAKQTDAIRQRPSEATALIGGTGKIEKPTDAKVIVAQTSIHVPDNDRGMVQRIVEFLTTQDYVGGVFVNNRFGAMAGALQMSDIGLIGSATTPKPAIVVNFKSFVLDSEDPFMTGIIVGGVRQQGQGDHGSLARANTLINMAAIGPDFKKRFVDRAPVGNADVQPTLAHILKMKIPSLGKLRGRVLSEALAGGRQTVKFTSDVARSRPSQRGESTVLMYQRVDDHAYLDEACFTKERTCE